jgi:acetyl esterase/lipase
MRILRNLAYGNHPRQIADVYLSSRPNAPIILFVHGGSWITGSKEVYRFVGRALSKLGCVAVVINYRLRPEVDFPVYVEDAARSLSWAHQTAPNWGADPDRVFIMGHSAGGHIAACAAIGQKYLPDAPWLLGMVGLAGGYSVHPGSNSDADANNLVHPTSRKFLLLHGRRDVTVDPKVSRRFYESLTSTGVPVTFTTYNLGHMTLMGTFLPIWRLFSAVPRQVRRFIEQN